MTTWTEVLDVDGPEYPEATNTDYGFCLESKVVLIKTVTLEYYTARYRVMLDDEYEKPDPDQPARWVLEGQDGYDLALEVVAAWIHIPD